MERSKEELLEAVHLGVQEADRQHAGAMGGLLAAAFAGVEVAADIRDVLWAIEKRLDTIALVLDNADTGGRRD
jgi:hypothetical protein